MALLDRHVKAQEQHGAALDWAIQATPECTSFSPVEYYAVMHLLLNRWLFDVPTSQEHALKKELAVVQMIEQSRERQLAALLLHLGYRVGIHAEDLERACTATLCSRGPLSGAYLELWTEEQKAQE